MRPSGCRCQSVSGAVSRSASQGARESSLRSRATDATSGRLVSIPLAVLVMLLAVVVGSDAGLADDRPDPLAPSLTLRERLDALVERVKLEQKSVETMEADFIQDKVSSMLLEPERARGEFSYQAPDSVRWEYLSPKPIVVLINEDELVTWYRDLGTAERLKVKRYSEEVFKYLGASGSLETLMEYFELNVAFPTSRTEPYHLHLLPRYPRIEKRVKAMELWIDGESFLPFRLRYEEPNGDHTEYRFLDMRINGDIPEERFELHLPSDVTVREVELTR